MPKTFPENHDYWTLFEESTSMTVNGKPVALDLAPGERIYVNNRYQVNVTKHLPMKEGGPTLHHLSIKRIDKAPVRSWRDFQKIKNLLVGKEALGMEIFPPESSLVDSANQYHLWVFVGLTMADLGFGFTERIVSEETIPGSVQAPFSKHDKPTDLKTSAEMEAILQRDKENPSKSSDA